MKYLLLIALISLAACGNKKAVIVEQIKSYKDSLRVLELQRSDLLIAVSELQDKYSGQQGIDSVTALQKKQAPIETEIFLKKAVIQGKIDSLKLDLEKY